MIQYTVHETCVEVEHSAVCEWHAHTRLHQRYLLQLATSYLPYPSHHIARHECEVLPSACHYRARDSSITTKCLNPGATHRQVDESLQGTCTSVPVRQRPLALSLPATQVRYNNIAQACHPVLLIDDPPP